MLKSHVLFSDSGRLMPGSSGALRAIACLVVAAMTGCHLPALCCPQRGPELPGRFTLDTGSASLNSSAERGLVSFFDDPALIGLLTDGLARNLELRGRNQEIQIARNEVMARRGAYFPFVSLGARGGFERNSKYTPLGAAEEQLTYPGEHHFPDPVPNTRITADLTWQLDVWRQLRNARDAAIQRYCAAIEARNYVVTRFVSEIATTYYELLALDKRLEFLNQTIELQQQSLEVARAQKAAARGTELAVQRFIAEVRKNESQRSIVRQQIIEAENRINLLVGRFPQPVERSSWDLIKLDSQVLNVGVPAQLLRNRRDIRAAEREIAAAGLDVQVARANFYPKVTITAGVGFEAFSPRYLFDPGAFIANAAGELVAPLINRAAIKAEYLSANARQLQAVYAYQFTVLNAFTEVVNRANRAENYRKSVAIKQDEVKALEESVDVARNLFKAPLAEEFDRVEYVDVLLAIRDLLESRVALIEAKQQQLAAIISAYQALGGGYLLTDDGDKFSELFCKPRKMAPVGIFPWSGPQTPSDPSAPADDPGIPPLPPAPAPRETDPEKIPESPEDKAPMKLPRKPPVGPSDE